jgi:hypothetical protein
MLTMILAGVAAAALAGAQASSGSQFGEWTGRVQTGVMAIGGESTGTRLATGDATFELSATGAIAARLRELAGQEVTLRGRLRVRPGVEIGARRIITVTEVRRPGPSVRRPGGDLIYLAFWWRGTDGRIGEKIAALPAGVRTELARRLARRQASPPDTFVESPEAALARRREELEDALVAYAGPQAAAEAAAYAAGAALSSEWEGFPDGPLGEAAYAADYLEMHPDSALRQYLELFQLQRLRAAFEAGEFSAAFPPAHLNSADVAGFSRAARGAADRYRALWARVQASSEALFAALAADIDAEAYVYIDVGAHPGNTR